jgi:hypothetical protein
MIMPLVSPVPEGDFFSSMCIKLREADQLRDTALD